MQKYPLYYLSYIPSFIQRKTVNVYAACKKFSYV